MLFIVFPKSPEASGVVYFYSSTGIDAARFLESVLADCIMIRDY